MTRICRACPSCQATLEFTRSDEQGRVVASCATCGHDYWLTASAVEPLGPTAPDASHSSAPRQ